ncbi:MAG: CBS domain-containing protein [Gemmataceae bacterium]
MYRANRPAFFPAERRMELARNLKAESVSRVRPGPYVCLPPDATVADAVERMRGHRVGCVLVCDAAGRLVGIFTERDLLRRVLATGTPLDVPVGTCMTPSPRTAGRGEAVGVAVRRMQRGGYRHLPVVDETMRPVGVLSARGVVHYLVEHFPSTIYCLPPDPDVYPLQREGA